MCRNRSIAAWSLVGFALVGVLAPTSPVWAQKVNLVYYEDAPVPIGTISTADIEALAASDFTHVVFAFVNFCTLTPQVDPKTNRIKKSCLSGGPTIVWNIQPVYQQDGSPYPEVASAIQKLVNAGKKVYLSTGGWKNEETWQYFANLNPKIPDPKECPSGDPTTTYCAAVKLQQFMNDYHITGVDLNFESYSSTSGVGHLAAALAALDPVPPTSSAPFSTDPTGMGPRSAQWQYCTLKTAGVAPTLVNRQYYAGGFSGTQPSQVLAAVQGDLKPFPCPGSGSQQCSSPSSPNCTAIPAEVLNVGLAPTSTQVPQNQANCTPATESPIYGGCQGIAKAIAASSGVPAIAGAYVWDYDVLSDPDAWACEMNVALNGTTKTCK